MNFADAVRSVFSKYATFTGRARRSEFWWFVLFSAIVNTVASVLDAVVGNKLIEILVTLALLLPSLAVTVRRLHDTGRSGWWILIALIPLIGVIVLLVLRAAGQPARQSNDLRPVAQAGRPGPRPTRPATAPPDPQRPGGQPARPEGGRQHVVQVGIGQHQHLVAGQQRAVAAHRQ